MALLISKSDTASLTIEGTTIGLDSVYARISLSANQDGIGMQAVPYHYESLAAFEAGAVPLSIVGMEPDYFFKVDIAAGETQTILLASEKVKASLEAKGYTVEIVEL